MCFCLWSRYFSNQYSTYIKEIPPRPRSSGQRFRFHRSSPFPTSTYFSNYSFTKIMENTLSRSTAARRRLCAQHCKVFPYRLFGTDVVPPTLQRHSLLAVLTTYFIGAFRNCIWALVQGNPIYVFNFDKKPVSIGAIPVIVQSTKPNGVRNA